MSAVKAYEPDRSLVGKARRRLMRLYRRRPARGGDQRPRLSITFDDVPLSAAATGAEILARYGLKGVYFISAGLLGADGPMGRYADWADIERLQAQGHEIGCHTFNHADLGQADGDVAMSEIEANQAAFDAHGVPAPRSFAYPYGDVARGPKDALASRFGLLRALHHGLIEPGADLNQAPSVMIEGPGGKARALPWIRRAAERKAWLILNTHDVSPEPSAWGCTPQTLVELIEEALRLGFEIVTVADGVRAVA